MKYGYAVKKNGILYAPGMEVPGDSPVKVELTNDVSESALDEQDKPKRGRKSKEE